MKVWGPDHTDFFKCTAQVRVVLNPHPHPHPFEARVCSHGGTVPVCLLQCVAAASKL